LQQATPGTQIQIAPGTYTVTNGEIFPLLIPSGVTVVGNEASKGSGILIQGSGQFISPTFARQNITIRMENEAQLRGVTVTNPEIRGTAVWVESTTPVIANCTFINCKREGIFATGNAAPLVLDNVSMQNSASGFSIVRNVKGEWRRNVCRNTGFGIAIGGTASPLLTDNVIAENRAGIVMNQTARPILRKNTIEKCQEAGLVMTENSLPDLGTGQDPGGNLFRDNSQFDIQNASSLVLNSVGNQLNPIKLSGQISLDGSQVPEPTPTPAPTITPPPTTPRPTPGPTPPGSGGLPDIRGHWSEGFVQALVGRGAISGFPDGSFKPDAPLTRAQYAAILAKTFDLPLTRPETNFVDVPAGFWAFNAIVKANRMGFVSGFPDGSFRPDQNLTRVQAIVSLVSGLGLTGGVIDALSFYSDRVQIPAYATDELATATQRRMVINYPTVRQLEPMRDITRGEVSALIYQALVALNQASAIPSNYIVDVTVPTPLFTDIQGHWAAEFIQRLASQNLVSGFEDGSFKPDAKINRAQYAAIVARALNPTSRREAIQFPDVPADFWAKAAIEQAYRGGFISGFPDGTFQPSQNVLRLQILLSLVSGLGLPAGDINSLGIFDDRATIPANAQATVAGATQNQLVVNYPNVRQLNPLREATRADVVAMIYQAQVRAGKATPINSPYIVSV
jgi:parallel beta-helix repeat protein